MWSPITHIPHRNLPARSTFVVLSTANSTALTLSDSHMVYVSDPAAGLRVPAPARDVKVRHRHSAAFLRPSCSIHKRLRARVTLAPLFVAWSASAA